MSKLTWTKWTNGDLMCREHPIKLQKPYSRHADSPGWAVRVPYERDDNFDDGWAWRYLEDPAKTLPIEMGGGLKANNAREAKALVDEHLDHVLAAIPADYGQPESPEDLEDDQAFAQYDAEQAAGTLRTVPHSEARRQLGLAGDIIPEPVSIVPWDDPNVRPGTEPPPSIAVELREVIVELDRSIDELRRSVAEGIGWPPGLRPEEVRDATGAYVLGDWLAAKANALAALANLERNR